MTSERHLLGLLPEELGERLAAWGEPPYRAGQVFRWLHARGVLDASRMSDLPPRLRARLAEALPTVAAIDRVLASADGTRKVVVRFPDDTAVETVLMPTPRPGAVTQCLSTQVGCAMGCVFCHSGVAGLARNLTAAEIVAQVLLARPLLADEERLGGAVYMGMGEPLHNYDEVVRSVRLLTHPDGVGLSTRRVTISTVGLVPELERLGRDLGGQIGLAVSFHGASSGVRRALVPIERRHPVDTLVAALRRYPLPPRRRITIEYTLVAGMNDTLAEADRLADRLRGLPVKVNLIPLNPHEGTSLAPPPEAHVAAFRERLAARGLSVFVRRRRGDEIAAACGQLALRGNAPVTRRRPGAGGRGSRPAV